MVVDTTVDQDITVAAMEVGAVIGEVAEAAGDITDEDLCKQKLNVLSL